MSETNQGPDAYAFIHENIDSVPHLESLILLWNSRPVGWTEGELASRLYISREQVGGVLRDLVRLQVVQETPGNPARYSYFPKSEEQNELMHRIDYAYRRDLVRISTMIHSKASSSVREFAKAFRLKKDREK
jgi:sugar-specific transcriptional regulator TrmB